MNASAPLIKEIMLALGVATLVVVAVLTVVVRLLRRKLVAAEPK